MEMITNEEIDFEIQRIKGTSCLKDLKVTKTNVKSINVLENLKQLAQEFDYLGIPSLTEAVNTSNSGKHLVTSLIYAAKDLIHVHRKMLNEHQQKCVDYVQLEKERKTLDKMLESRNQEITCNEKLFKTSQEQIKILHIEMSQLKRDCDMLKEQNQLLKRQNTSLENSYKHKLMKASCDMEQMQSKLNKNCEKYISQDEKLSKLFVEYKSNESNYKDIIKTLNANNNLLMEEILNLKEDLTLLLIDKVNS